jgi:hypothetical protein
MERSAIREDKGLPCFPDSTARFLDKALGRLHPGYTVLVGLLVGAAAALSCEAAERARAEVRCTLAGVALTYDCLIRLTHARTGAPLTGAQLTVAADMPSMPMAHAVKPVAATGAGEPGLYRARIELEMRGEWALRLKLSAPFRDQIISLQHFDE